MQTLSRSRFIQELITDLGKRSQSSFPFVIAMCRLAPEVVAVIEYDGELELECVIYYNSSSWLRARSEPEPSERVYEAPRCLATIRSYYPMTQVEVRALAMAELQSKNRQDFYPQPLPMEVPESLRARGMPRPEDRFVPLPA